MSELNKNIFEEWLLCKNNPYYFATKYCKVNGKPFTTTVDEKTFNNLIKKIKNDKVRK